MQKSLISLSIFLLVICCYIPVAIATSPEAVNLQDEGVQAISRGDFPLAIQKLEDALRIDPSYKPAKENLIIAFNKYGLQLQPEEAIEQFYKAYFLNRSNDITRFNLEAVIKRLGKNPQLFEDRVALGDAAISKGRIIGAIIEYETALSMQDDPAIRQKLIALKDPRQWDKILSNAKREEADVDYKPYTSAMEKRIIEHWSPPLKERSKNVIVAFKIHKDGTVSDVKLEKSSIQAEDNNAAIEAVRSASPFDPLPKGSKETVDIQFTFAYNVLLENANQHGDSFSAGWNPPNKQPRTVRKTPRRAH